MIALSSTWREVVMLLVAGAAGLLGGVGAWLLESKLEAKAAAGESPPPSGGRKGGSGKLILGIGGAIFLGGVAAVIATYFFQPIKEVEGDEGTTRYYELIRLVPLSLLVGTAGTAFLQSMQSRLSAALTNVQLETSQVATNGVIALVRDDVKVATKAGIEESPELARTLEDAGLTQEKATSVVGEIAEQASEAVEERIEPHVEAAKRLVAATGPMTAEDLSGTAKTD